MNEAEVNEGTAAKKATRKEWTNIAVQKRWNTEKRVMEVSRTWLEAYVVIYSQLSRFVKEALRSRAS